MLAHSLLLASLALQPVAAQSKLSVSPNHRFLQTDDGAPFFWLADTGWLMFQKLNREETERYLEDRRRKGFNVIQAMVLQTGSDVNSYGAPALTDKDPARPAAAGEWNYWTHVDWVADLAASKGIYLAMVPAWGALIKRGQVDESNAGAYARFLGERYGKRWNVVWLNGGDLQGSVNLPVWHIIGRTLKQTDPGHLVTFHPFGRTQSSTWFHDAAWLDFNMFQSGHRRYEQDTDAQPKGEDNWKYVFEDYAKQPPKPTLDGEPSYEGIPQGLHDPKEPRWKDHDARRYAYWSVFAGAFGHTYGNNSVMQMRKAGDAKAAYGATETWVEALDNPGAGQMQHLKKLMLSRPYFERVNDDAAIVGGSGARYERVTATKGRAYLFVYSYLGRPFRVQMGRISGKRVKAWWFDPRTGVAKLTGTLANAGVREFAPLGATGQGNDWVLVLDDADARFAPPGDRAR